MNTRASWILGTFVALFVMAPSAAQAKRYSWQRDPGPIVGRWTMSCADALGSQIEIKLVSPKKAEGRILSARGTTKTRGYKAGELVLRLVADDHGDWVGKLHWRSVAGAKRWDPIRFVATAKKLDATMNTDDCYQKMRRAQ